MFCVLCWNRRTRPKRRPLTCDASAVWRRSTLAESAQFPPSSRSSPTTTEFFCSKRRIPPKPSNGCSVCRSPWLSPRRKSTDASFDCLIVWFLFSDSGDFFHTHSVLFFSVFYCKNFSFYCEIFFSEQFFAGLRREKLARGVLIVLKCGVISARGLGWTEASASRRQWSASRARADRMRYRKWKYSRGVGEWRWVGSGSAAAVSSSFSSGLHWRTRWVREIPAIDHRKNPSPIGHFYSATKTNSMTHPNQWSAKTAIQQPTANTTDWLLDWLNNQGISHQSIDRLIAWLIEQPG